MWVKSYLYILYVRLISLHLRTLYYVREKYQTIGPISKFSLETKENCSLPRTSFETTVGNTIKREQRCFLRPTWLHNPRCLALGEWSHHRDYLGHKDVFCRVLLCIFAVSSASLRSIPFLSFIVPIFAWNVPLILLIFLKRSLVFPILLLSSISLHWSLRKAFWSLLAILWNSTLKWVYLSFSTLPLASLLFSVICKASSDNHFAFLHFFFLGMVLIPVSYTMSWASIHSSSDTLSDLVP